MKIIVCFALLLILFACQNKKGKSYDEAIDTLTYYPLEDSSSMDKYAHINLLPESKNYCARWRDSLYLFEDVSVCLLEGTDSIQQVNINNFLWDEDTLYFLHAKKQVNVYNTNGKFLYILDKEVSSCDIDISSKRIALYDNLHKILKLCGFSGDIKYQYSLPDSFNIADIQFVNSNLILLAVNAIPNPETYYYNLLKQKIVPIQKPKENTSLLDTLRLNLNVFKKEMDDGNIPLFVFYHSTDGLFGKYQFSDYLYHYTDSGAQIKKVFDIGSRRIKISNTAHIKPGTSFFLKLFAETERYNISQYSVEVGRFSMHGDNLGTELSVRDKRSGAGDEGFLITLPKQIVYMSGLCYLSLSKNQHYLFGIRNFSERKPHTREIVSLPDSLKGKGEKGQLLITKFKL